MKHGQVQREPRPPPEPFTDGAPTRGAKRVLVQNDELLPHRCTVFLQPRDEVRLLEQVVRFGKPPDLAKSFSATKNEAARTPLEGSHAPILALPRELEPPWTVNYPDRAAATEAGPVRQERNDVTHQFRRWPGIGIDEQEPGARRDAGTAIPRSRYLIDRLKDDPKPACSATAAVASVALLSQTMIS